MLDELRLYEIAIEILKCQHQSNIEMDSNEFDKQVLIDCMRNISNIAAEIKAGTTDSEYALNFAYDTGRDSITMSIKVEVTETKLRPEFRPKT